MRAWAIAVVLGMAVPMARAACSDAGVVRDWGLHRTWRVERDCAHPERPAVLVEMPWTAPAGIRRDAVGPGPDRPPLVRAGMRVALTWRDENSAGDLAGTALTTASAGGTVAVRSRFGTAILHGVVRGPGWVELEPGRVVK
jgi:hypothetical protein